MRAMILKKIVLLKEADTPLELVDLPEPEPGAGEVRIKVAACGVCHTELDEIEGRTAPPRLPVVPGHEVVGHVDRLGAGAAKHKSATAWAWVGFTGATVRPDENVSPAFRATGRDANGGYAEYMTVPEDYAYPIPAVFSDAEAAPLLCAGAVGWRALKLCEITDGEPIGLTGFGGSAHLVLQMVRQRFPNSPVYVFARDAKCAGVRHRIGARVGGRHDRAGAGAAAGDHRHDAGVAAGGRGAGQPAAGRAAGR